MATKHLTLPEVEQTLYLTLKEKGRLFPRNEVDVENIEKQLNLDDVVPVDSEKFRKLLRQMYGN